jgi:formate hydrogenlyase subunit 3/multisubunit Na+/H+ antiporter MnhD subunit
MIIADIFILFTILSFVVFIVRGSFKYYSSLLILLSGIIISSVWSLQVLTSDESAGLTLQLSFLQHSLLFVIDKISAFFILVINITVPVGFLYAKGYLKPYEKFKTPLHFSIHYFSYIWLYLSMILVVMIRSGVAFLVAWEMMAISSFLLVIFDAEDRLIMKTGISYLIQMHVGMFFILVAFLIVERETGQINFDALPGYFSQHSNIVLFLLFFIGFGIKAGFVPMHTWLPRAHPAAPSHVSGVMSGVMIKMGIYGIVRVLISLQNDLLLIGLILLGLSVISALYGVMMAIMQHDLKQLLAYHSIENIGIIGIGLGLGIIGIAKENHVLSILGFSGGLLHVLNHSLFKSLLFFNAGSVYHATHTRNIEELGGLMKKMPWTAALFLTGSLAICGLPPFNGFISEYLIAMGMFKSLSAADLNHSIVLLSAITGLILTGGLAIFCFTKAFGIVFLGQPRSAKASSAREADMIMILPQVLTITFILLIGLVSPLFVRPVIDIVAGAFRLNGSVPETGASIVSLSKVSILSGIFIAIITLLLVYRYYHLKRRIAITGPVWGCGYTVGSPKQQYTATSYAYNYNHLAKPLLRTQKIMEEMEEGEIFPGERDFKSFSEDVFRTRMIDVPVDKLSGVLKKIAVMQTGEIRHYILYAFVFILLVLLLTLFNLI